MITEMRDDRPRTIVGDITHQARANARMETTLQAIMDELDAARSTSGFLHTDEVARLRRLVRRGLGLPPEVPTPTSEQATEAGGI